jgi:hypothetical protein
MGSYRERLLVPVSYWLLAVPVVVTLGAEAYFFVDGFIPPLVIGLFAVIAGVFLLHWSGATIEVTGGVLRAGKDTLALGEVTQVMALDERQAAQLRGPRADPAAHLLLRPYLKRAVYIGLADPAAGAPYWLVATRHPEQLAAAVAHGMRAADGQAADKQAGGQEAGGQEGDRQAADRQPGDRHAEEHQAGDWESVG